MTLRNGIITLLLVASPGASYAQDSADHFDSIEATVLLSRRDREAIHPGEPLVITGLGQGENDFRSGLRAAARGNFVPVAVDSAENYARQLALFEGSRVGFDHGLERSYLPRDTRGGAAPPPRLREDRVRPAADGEEPMSTTWIGMLVAAVASVGLFLTRGNELS